VGTGTVLTEALPATGAIPIPANQVVQTDNGQVIYTSTDERGDFKVGDQLTINGSTGTITGDTFDKSLFAVMTPYILALEG
jgi:mRNA degradation ribonuclease J1/J2